MSHNLNISKIYPMHRLEFAEILRRVNYKITYGDPYEGILDYIYESVGSLVPYDRMNISIVSGDMVKIIWIKSKFPVLHSKIGFTTNIKGTSLETVIKTGTPTIIDDMREYSKKYPHFNSLDLTVKDGVVSSLVCPLLSNGKSIGIVGFSSAHPNVFTKDHISTFEEIAVQISVLVERENLRKFFEENKSKDKMLSMVVHDLRSPLGVMQGFLELTREKEWYQTLDESNRKVFDILQKNCSLMLELVDTLTDASKLTRNQLDFNFRNVELSAFLNQICQKAKMLASQKDIVLEASISENLPKTAYFDPLRISQVIDNLVSNSVKFSKSGTKIELSVVSDSDNLIISVKDQGPGIPENEIPKLFKEFGTTSVRPTEGESSTGLGLSIVRAIVERHHGDISLKTRVGEGSTFEVKLPVLG